MTRIILVRHGQTEWNAGEERFRGSMDVPLDATGLAQAGAAAERIAGEWKVAAVYSSPLQRAMKTAEIIAGRHGLAPVPCPGLVDMDYGEWQGLTVRQVRDGWPREFENWLKFPENATVPGGGSLHELFDRGTAAVKELSGRHAGETIVAVGHTVINRLILLGILGLGLERFWSLRQDTCAINVIEAGRSMWTLASLNDTCHLSRKS